jgi:hypothetical protein
VTAQRSSPPRRFTGDVGMVGGLEVLPFGLLTFVVGALLVSNAWAVVDTKYMVTSAAREAVRAYVEAPDETTASGRARERADEAVRAHGRDTHDITVDVAYERGRAWSRCARVAVTVRSRVPAFRLPWIEGYGHTFDVSARHSEIVDPFRSGLPGAASCP